MWAVVKASVQLLEVIIALVLIRWSLSTTHRRSNGRAKPRTEPDRLTVSRPKTVPRPTMRRL